MFAVDLGQMRRVSKTLFLLISSLLALGLSGCPGFFTPRTDTGTTTGSKFAYVANFQSATAGSISIFSINASTGALTSSGSAVSTGSTSASNGPAALVTVLNKFLYSANDGGTVSAFTIDATTGALTPIAGSPFPAGTNPNSIVADPTGKFLYVGDSGSKDITGYSINPTTGVLTQTSLTPAGSNSTTAGPAVGLAMHPMGKFLYVAMDTSGIAIFSVDPTTGNLTFVATVAPQTTGAMIQSIAIEKTGSFAYAADGVSAVEEFSINTSTGALTLIAGSPVPAGSVPIVLTADIAGAHVYVANQTSNNVFSYGILTTGALSQISGGTIAAGSSPSSIAMEPSGKFVYVTNFNGSPDISIFSVDSSGKLALAGSQSSGVSTANAASIAFR